jgi:hypothetical protein
VVFDSLSPVTPTQWLCELAGSPLASAIWWGNGDSESVHCAVAAVLSMDMAVNLSRIRHCATCLLVLQCCISSGEVYIFVSFVYDSDAGLGHSNCGNARLFPL